MRVKSSSLLSPHYNGPRAHQWIGFGVDSKVQSPWSIPPVIQEFLELIFCLYVINRNFPSVNELEFVCLDKEPFKSVKNRLEHLFYFLTNRNLRLLFIENPNVRSTSYQTILPLVSRTPIMVPLFSGGVDSTASVIRLKSSNTPYYLSHTITSDVIYGRVKRLYQEHFRNAISILTADSRYRKPSDSSISSDWMIQTRGLLFLANALAHALALGTKHVIFGENGPLMINLEVSAADRATRNTDPILVDTLQDVFSELANEKITIDCVFRKLTKAEIIRIFPENELLSKTYSCFIGSGKHKGQMCGLCYGCFIRRVSAYAAEMEEYDGEYVEDYLLVSPESRRKREKIGIIWRNIRFSIDVINGKKVVEQALWNRDLRQLFMEKEVVDIYTRQAQDMVLGLSRHLESLSKSSLGSLGTAIKRELRKIDSKMLEERKESLKQI